MINFSEITEQKIAEKFEGLSQDLKNILSSISTSTTVENIAAKYRLDGEKITMLIQLVGLVILGFASFENMKEEMKETIDISPQFIPLIADEIRQKIFLPVMGSLQETIIKKPMAPPIPMSSIPVTPAAPIPTTPTPAPLPPQPVMPPTALRPADQYREPTMGPEIIDLRKTPPPPTPTFRVGAPTSPLAGVGVLPVSPAPIPPRPAMIEANPHKTEVAVPTIPTPTVDKYREDINVLDLRQDKGEF